MRRIISFGECDSPEEVQKLVQEIFDNQELTNAKVCQLDEKITKLTSEPIPEQESEKKKYKKRNEGKTLMKTLIGLVIVAMVLFGISQAAYKATDINYEVASNPEMLSQYLRDSIGAGVFTFTPTTTAPTGVEGMVYYNNTANALELYTGAAWVTLDAATGVSLDSAYNLGVGITVDNGAVTLTATNAANNTVFALVQSDTGTSVGMTITNAGTGNSIDIEGQSAAKDIEGTGDTWSVSSAGVATLVGAAIGNGDLTLSENGAVILNDTDGEIQFADASEDISMGFATSDTIVWTSDTGVVTWDFGAINTVTGLTTITGDAADFTIQTTGDATGEDLIISQAGTGDNQVIIQSAGTAANAIAIQSSKGIDIDAVDDLTISCTSSTTADDLVIEQIGANNSSVLIKAAGTGTDAISAIATAGGVVISGIDDVAITCASTTTADDLVIAQTGAVNASILLNAAGTGADAIGLNATGTAGGIAAATTDGAITLNAAGAANGDITLTAADNLSIITSDTLTLTNATKIVINGMTTQLIEIEGTADDNEATLSFTNPTADVIWTFPTATAQTVSVFSSTLATNAPQIANSVWGGTSQLIFEGSSADANEHTIVATNPTADIVWTLPDAAAQTVSFMSSTLATNMPQVANSVWGGTNQFIFEGSAADNNETILTATAPTADRTITFPDKTGTVQLASASSALTPSGSVTLTVGLSNVYTDTPTDNEDQTITFSGAGTAGDVIMIIFTCVGTANEVITFHATLVSSVGTLTCDTTAARYYVVTFVSNGTHWYEVSRTAVQT